MARILGTFVSLLGFWLMLSGQWHFTKSGDQYLLFCGVLSCIFVTWIASRKGLVDEEGHPIHLAFGMLTYVPWLFWEIILANIAVAKIVCQPACLIEPHMITVPYDLKTDLSTFIYANSITLTPGTVSVSINTAKKEILVHALTKEAAEDLLSGKMHDRVKALEG